MLRVGQIDRIGRFLKMAEVIYYEVASSNVQEVGYDRDDGSLYVRFLPKGNSPGSLYIYKNVEPEIFSEFLDSDSKGRYVWQYLRDRYEYARIE